MMYDVGSKVDVLIRFSFLMSCSMRSLEAQTKFMMDNV